MSDALDDFLRRREQGPQAAARAAVRGATTPPEQAATAARVSRDTGVGYPVVAVQPEPYQRASEEQQADHAILRAPRLAGWLTQRESHAPIARDALPALADVEQHITTQEARGEALATNPMVYLASLITGGWRKAKAIAEEGSLAGVGRSLEAGVYDLAGQVAGGVQAASELADRYSPSGIARRAVFGEDIADAMGPLRPLTDLAARRAAGWQQLANYTAPQVQSEELQGAYSGLRSLPASATSLVGGAYYRSAKVGAVLMGGLVGGGSFSAGRRQGLGVDAAAAYGSIDGLIETATEFLPTKRLLGHIGDGTGLGKRLLSAFAADIPGEQLATVGQDFNQWALIDANKGKPFSAYLAERPDAAYQTLIASIVGSTVVTSAASSIEYAAGKMGRAIPRLLPAEDNAHFLSVLGQLSTANTVLSRDTQTFESFIREASDGTKATDVYIDAAKLGEVFQQANLAPEEAFDMTGLTPGEIEQAVARGEDIRIPIEQFAARIAPSALSAQLIPHLRLDPEEMSVEEAKVYLQGAQEEFEANAERALADSQRGDESRSSRDRVREALVGELTRTGRFNEKTNGVYADVVANFYATFGARLGKTAEELAGEVMLRVQSGENAAPSFDQNKQPASVNIGLDLPTGGTFDPQLARDALAAMGVAITREAIHQSDSEQTLVAELDQPLTAEQLHALSVALGQEAVAQHLGDGAGMLEGPLKENWGEFNPEYFFGIDGSRLRDPAAQAVDPVAVFFQNSASLAGHNPTARYMAVSDGTDGPFKSQEANPGSAGSEPGLTLDIASAAVASGGVVELQGEFFPGVALGIDPNESIGEDEYIELDDGTERPTQNADGDFIATTKAAVRAFWNWFGDSEMVDTDGRPLVFYHGTRAPFTGDNAISKREFAFADNGGTIFFATGENGYGTAKGFVQNNAPTEEGVLRAYLRAESVDEYDADGRMWDQVVPVDDYEVSEARRAWVAAQMEGFNPETNVDVVAFDENGEQWWEVHDDGATIIDANGGHDGYGKYSDEETATEKADELREELEDEARDAREEELSEEADDLSEGDLVEAGYLDRAGESTDAVAATAMGRYDAVLIGDVDEGSGATTVAIILGEPKNVKAVDNQGTFDPEDPRIYYQSEIAARTEDLRRKRGALGLFRAESLYPDRASRLADDTVVVSGVPPYYPERLVKIAEQIGAKEIIVVEDSDKRLDQGVALWHTRPPLEADGSIRLDHWGTAGIDRTDPTMWGQSGALPSSERSSIGSSLPRTYFGIASGQPGGYVIEFPGRMQYQASLMPDRLYDIGADPDGLKREDGVNALERRIAAAGYAGYWSNNDQLGLVATVFEPLAVKPATAYQQDAVFYSALERAVERSAQAKASGAQWIATLKKTPGVKQEELEWTGLLDFLADVEGSVTREAILELVRGGGVRVDEVVLGQLSDEEKLAQFGLSLDDTESEDYESILADEGLNPQFASWSSDPQNDSYRELLITLPRGEPGNPKRSPSTHWDTEGVIAHARFMDKQDADGKRVLFIEEVQSDWHQKGRDQGYVQPVDPKSIAPAQSAFDLATQAHDEAQRREDEASEALGAYMGAKWQEMFDKIDDPVQRNAFAEAIRQPGPDWSYSELTREARNYRGVDNEIEVLLATANDARVAQINARETMNLRGRELDIAKGFITNGGIPNAPFKTTWPALVMKRMIRWAAEHGYEKIAWTTGQQQAERYNLSTAVGSLDVRRGGDGGFLVRMDALAAGRLAENGLGIQTNDYGSGRMALSMTEGQMKEAFGADIAKRAVEGADESAEKNKDVVAAAEERKRAAEEPYLDLLNAQLTVGLVGMDEEVELARLRRASDAATRDLMDVMRDGFILEGEDLRVGGEGMKQFYDRNLVNITNDLVKKYGAKVGAVNVGDTNPQRAKIDAEIQRKLGLVAYGIESAQEAEQRAAEFEAQAERGEGDPAKAKQWAKQLRDGMGLFAERDRLARGTDQPGFGITPELAEAAMGGFPLFQKTGAPRGQIAFGADITQVPSMISILRGADLSTFLHETGHFFFEVLNHYASQPGTPADVVADRDAMLRYIGVTSVTEWENMTPEARRVGHETVARSFEAYLFEGRAPSVEMRSLFQTLRSWLRSVYTSLTQLKVDLTDEVRGVFDRMLASEDAIREVEADLEQVPLFLDKPETMSDNDWAEYQKLNTDATAEAAQALERRSLRDMRYAGRATAREVKRLQSEVADKRKAMREEVAPEIEALPVYRAIQYMRTGKIDGNETEGDHRLLTPEVRSILQLEDGEPLPVALAGMTSTDNGINPHQVAELFGYTSADHMVKDLLFASPLKEAIEAETDSRMRERYGELNSPEALQEAAHAAVHNDVRGRFAATELASLQNAPGKKRVLDGAARRLAEEMVAKLRIRDLRPSQYEAAERRASRAAQKAGTADIDEAVRQKRNQLFQFNAAKAAHAAVEEVKKARDYLTKFTNANTRKAIDVSYLDQIDQLLERYELRQVSNVEADRRKALAAWIEEQQAMGFEPMLTPEMLDEIGRKPWRELTVEEMRDLLDGIKNIEHLGRLTKKLLTAKDKADLNDAAGEVGETIRNNAFAEYEENIDRKTWWEQLKSGVDDFFAMHRKFANTVHVFDGNNYGGVVWERFIRGMNEAGSAESVRNRAAGEALSALFAPLKDTARKLYIPEIGKSLSLEGRLAVALNWGNQTNRARILDGDKWTLEQAEAVLATLTPEQWDFVEGAWAYINSYRDEIVAKERRVSGVTPAMVEAEPFQQTLPDGSLRMLSGGYYPIKYDPDRSTKAEQHLAADIAKQMLRGAFTRATTRRGHLKERVDTVNRPVRKDFGVLFEHVSQVVHDLSWHEYLIDANRLLSHGAVDSAVREHYGPATLRWMRKALEDIAAGDVGATNGLERGLTYIRTGASIAGLGWNLWTSLLQPIGLTQSWSRIGIKHVGRGIAELFGTPGQLNDKVNWVYEVSPFMRTRGDTMQREINEIRNKVSPKSPLRQTVEKAVPASAVDVVADSYFVLIAKAQLVADLPTWLGQYHKSLAAGEGADRAVLIADQAVIDSQGSGMLKDLAGVQRGGPWQKLWTNFYSYFSATYNLMADRTAQLKRVGPADLPYFAVDVALLSFVPATLTSLLYTLLKGDDDDWEKLPEKIAADNLNYMLGTMLGMREVGGAISGMAGYTGPAGARVFVELGKFGKQAGQGELDEPLLRSLNSLAGVLLHYPSGQVDRTVRGLRDYINGDAGPMAPLVGPPPKK